MQGFVVWYLSHTFERFSHWWQKTISMKQDCFWWARICTHVFWRFPIILSLFMIHVVWWGGRLLSQEGFVFMFATLLIFIGYEWFGWILLQIVKQQEEKTRRAHLNFVQNPAKNNTIFIASVLLNVAGIFLIPILTFEATGMTEVLLGLWVFLGSSIFSFATCDPLPTGTDKSKLQHFISSFKFSPALAPKGVRT
ncbi:MAG: hypothetical protein Q8R36_00830 [bacterium]|nr:hypothetical protein [bacterium]